MHAARRRGLTAVELLIALAVLALLASVALPSFGSLLSRQRLVAAAEALAGDLSQARFESAQSGQPLHLVLRSGPDWCWAVARSPGCDCAAAPAPGCALKTVRAAELPGLTLRADGDVQFGADALPPRRMQALLATRAGDETLQVRVSPLGRASVCSPSGVRGYPRC
ncbi:MAG: prepilin-type N-terminal cleavage/methylation domain-containing protein [Burkholderiales bacterium]|nr:prepilin-type N-terminal cleavage/methylation domain-containing protein [Burkholderiales bacterium]